MTDSKSRCQKASAFFICLALQMEYPASHKSARSGDNNDMIKILLYGSLGLLVEVAWTGTRSMLAGDATLTATTYLWMLPIYGVTALLLERVHDGIRDLPIWLRGSVWAVLILTFEYGYGYLLRAGLGVCPWDYTGAPYAVDGLIRLDYAPAWCLLGLLFEHLHDRLHLKRWQL